MFTTANYVTASKGRVCVGPGCASSTTEGLRSKPPGVKRRQKHGRVHFDPSLNWFIEEEKSLHSSAARRERLHQKKMARDIQMERKKNALQILKDPNKYDQIKTLYNANVEPIQELEKEYMKIALHFIIGYQGLEPNFQLKFEQLQKSNLTYEALSSIQCEALKSLSENGLFVNEFRELLPAEPVTDGSSSDDSNKQKRRKRTKTWDAEAEVSKKRRALNNGGPPSSPPGPNEVVGNNLFD